MRLWQLDSRFRPGEGGRDDRGDHPMYILVGGYDYE